MLIINLKFIKRIFQSINNIWIWQLSEKINRTKMTSSRALDELVKFNLVKYWTGGKTGRKNYYRRNNLINYYTVGLDYLKKHSWDKLWLLERLHPFLNAKLFSFLYWQQTHIYVPFHLALLKTKRDAIERAIASLPQREQYLFRLRYIEGKIWEDICIEMSYCYAQIHRVLLLFFLTLQIFWQSQMLILIASYQLWLNTLMLICCRK